MRTEPVKTIDNSPELLAKKNKKVNSVTRKVAIVFVLLVIIFLFFKMLLP